ncbi:hypothetical protein BDV59DRAFT_197022 [Aspergillus ambiguus]|uniref:uncharacterized protein n=1 Tax=Aspergillus ambiguus TaxID=176160 RepID=UPI003CCD538D
MPMNWNAEANEKLLFGILAQMRESHIKLDNKKLAEYMGNECTAVAVQLHLFRLRRQVQAVNSAENAPATNPPKRKATGEPKTPTKKGKEKKTMKQEMKEDEEDKLMLKQENGDDWNLTV